MKKHYLFFVSVAYSYPILRPLQDEIRRRGDDVAWFIEPDCPVLLNQDERWLQSVQEVMDYQPIAVFAPGNYIYDFCFPEPEELIGDEKYEGGYYFGCIKFDGRE